LCPIRKTNDPEPAESGHGGGKPKKKKMRREAESASAASAASAISKLLTFLLPEASVQSGGFIYLLLIWVVRERGGGEKVSRLLTTQKASAADADELLRERERERERGEPFFIYGPFLCGFGPRTELVYTRRFSSHYSVGRDGNDFADSHTRSNNIQLLLELKK